MDWIGLDWMGRDISQTTRNARAPGGAKNERFGREMQFSAKNCLKNSFFEYHDFGSTDFEQP